MLDLDDEYDHIDPSSVEYILENILYEPEIDDRNSKEYKELEENFNSVFTKFCNCVNSNCDGSDGICFHGGNYMLFLKDDTTTELILNPNRILSDLIYECSQYCKCYAKCLNTLIQKGPRKYLKIIEVEYNDKQYGLITTNPIPKGGFICEYVGEILTKSQASYRNLINENTNLMNYIICLNEFSTQHGEFTHQTFIDPSRKGNIGRYLNHSCDPNCELFSIRTDNVIPKIGIFAKRAIAPNEELFFHYAGEINSEDDTTSKTETRKICFCGSTNCQKYLPNLQY